MTIANALNQKISTPTIVYIDGNPNIGNDTTGNGSVLKPWATLSYAEIQLPASATDFYTVMVAGIIIDPNQIELKPNVNVRGYTQGSTITSPHPIIPHSSFNTILNQGPYLENLQITNDLDFDVSFVSSASQPYLQLNGVSVSGNFAVTGSKANNVVPYFFSYDSYFSGNVQFTNVSYTSFIDEFNALTINDSSVIIISPVIASLVAGSVYLNTNMSLEISGGKVSNIDLAAPSSLTFTPYFKITNCDIDESAGTKNLDGGNLILNTDVTSAVDYVLTNGASVNLLSQKKYLKPIPPITITADSANLTSDTDFYFINNSGPGIYTLPFAAGNGGREITIKKLSGSAFPIIIDPQGGESIDPTITFPVAQQYVGITFYSDGISTWWGK